MIFHSYVSLPEGIYSDPWLRARPDESIEAAAAAHSFPSATPGLSSPSEDCRPRLDKFPRIQLYCILYFLLLSVYCFPGIYIYIYIVYYQLYIYVVYNWFSYWIVWYPHGYSIYILVYIIIFKKHTRSGSWIRCKFEPGKPVDVESSEDGRDLLIYFSHTAMMPYFWPDWNRARCIFFKPYKVVPPPSCKLVYINPINQP